MPSKNQDNSKAKVAHLRPPKPCPICKKPSAQAFHPFCSTRCANIDLNRWLNGSYVIPASEDEEEDEMDQYESDD